MFSEGDYISYGCNGVCKVEGFTVMNAPGCKEEQQYYILRPVYHNRGMIYCPVNSKKGQIRRRILTEEESYRLLALMPQLKCIEFEDRKDFEEKFKAAMQSGSCEQWLKIIKTLWTEQDLRRKSGKKLTSTQERFFKSAKDNLCGELAVSLDRELFEIEKILKEQLNHCKTYIRDCDSVI